MLEQLDTLITETTDELHRLSLTEPWREQLPYLIQLPGIGVLTGMVILSAIGDVQRFPSAKKLVGYAGLGARIHASGQTHKTGGTLAPALQVQVSPNKAAKNYEPP